VEFRQTSVTSVTVLEWEIRVQFAPADKALGFEFGFVVQGEDCVGGQCTLARVCIYVCVCVCIQWVRSAHRHLLENHGAVLAEVSNYHGNYSLTQTQSSTS